MYCRHHDQEILVNLGILYSPLSDTLVYPHTLSPGSFCQPFF